MSCYLEASFYLMPFHYFEWIQSTVLDCFIVTDTVPFKLELITLAHHFNQIGCVPSLLQIIKTKLERSNFVVCMRCEPNVWCQIGNDYIERIQCFDQIIDEMLFFRWMFIISQCGMHEINISYIAMWFGVALAVAADLIYTRTHLHFRRNDKATVASRTSDFFPVGYADLVCVAMRFALLCFVLVNAVVGKNHLKMEKVMPSKKHKRLLFSKVNNRKPHTIYMPSFI